MFGSTFTGGGSGGESGSWTPVITLTANMNYVTSFQFSYIKSGNVVMFGGLLTLNCVAIGVASGFYMSLPLTTNFTAGADFNSNGTSPFFNQIVSGQPRIGTAQGWQQFIANAAGVDMFTRFMGIYLIK